MFVNNIAGSDFVGLIEVSLRVPRDTAQYFGRFIASGLLLGAAPVFLLVVLKIPLREVGLAAPKRFWKPRSISVASFIGIGILIGVVGSYDPALRHFYPFHPRLFEISRQSGGVVFLGHTGLYVFLYYLGWETTFRGVLVVFVTEPFVRHSYPSDPRLLIVALLQALPSAIIHFGHPQMEILGALLFGFAAGYFALVTRSIVPGLLVHAVAGVSLDLILVLFP